jgi:hypothetical protein
VAVPVISSVATVPKASSVEAVLHERLMPDRLHRWMDVHHDVIRCRKLPQPFRLGAVEEDAIRAVAIAGRQLPWRRPGGSSPPRWAASSRACALAAGTNSPG